MPGELAPLAPSWNEHRHPLSVGAEFLAELLEHPPLLAARKRKEDGDDDRKQTDREQRRPVHDTLAEEGRSEEHTSELQSLMRISYAVFCLTKKRNKEKITQKYT